MKAAVIQKNIPLGSEVEFVLRGGAKMRGRLLRTEDELLALESSGLQQQVFIDEISTFTIFDVAPPAPEPPELASAPAVDGQKIPWGEALVFQDELNAVLNNPEGDEAARSFALAKRFADEVIIARCGNDSQIRKVLFDAFRLVEHHRDIALADGDQSRSLLLSRTLLAINQALRSGVRLKPIDQFVDFYHFFVAIRSHLEIFRGETPVWEEFLQGLRTAVESGRQLRVDPVVCSYWERSPYLRTGFYRRFANLCRKLAEFAPHDPDEREQLETEAERFAKLGEASAAPIPTVEPRGQIVRFGPAPFGFIRGHNRQTFYVGLRDLLTRELREVALDAPQQMEIPVDFDVERAVDDNSPYDRAVRVRPPGSVLGEIIEVRPLPRYGFIRLDDGRRVHFHLNHWPAKDRPPEHAMPVLCWPEASPRPNGGLTSKHIRLVDPYERTLTVGEKAHRLVSEAAEARDEKDFERARALYEQGMEECPAPLLVCAYAAMMKLIDEGEARNVYERGLRIPEVARSAKVWEDAGVFATQTGDPVRAIELLERSVALAREHPEQRGLKGALMALGHAYYRLGEGDAIRQADACYQEAIRLHGGLESFRAKLPSSQLGHVDEVQAALARLRSRTPGGAKAWAFLESCGLRVDDARATGDYADLLCQITNDSLRRNYGLGERIFVRCYVREQETSPDPDTLADEAQAAITEWGCDERVAMLILPKADQTLWGRLKLATEPRTGKRPLVIVPLAQHDLEKTVVALRTLHDTLAAWLYEQDLFPRVGIVSGAEFFGRQKVLAEINRLLLRDDPIGLFGLRRTGKTSVMHAMKEQQREQGSIVLHSDLLGSSGSSINWMLHALADDLRQAAREHLPPDFHWDLGGRFESHLTAGDFSMIDGFFSDLSRVLRAFESLPACQRPRVILVVDELETLQNDSPERTLDVIRNSRSLQNRFQSGFNYILTAANPSICEQAQIDKRDNPIFGCIHKLYLEFLSPEECRNMITELGQGMGVCFTGEAHQRIYRATGGHPFLARWLCSIASGLRPKRPAELSVQDILKAEGIYVHERRDELSEIRERLERDYPAELEILRRLASSADAVPLRVLMKDGERDDHRAISHLLGYQLAAATPRGIVLRQELMRQYLTDASPLPPPPRPRSMRPWHPRHSYQRKPRRAP